MSKNYATDIYIGEEVRLPDKCLESNNSSRLLSATCVGHTKTGILFDLKFMPGFGTEEPDKWHYKRFISYASIYCGNINIIRRDKTQVKAFRTVKEMRI